MEGLLLEGWKEGVVGGAGVKVDLDPESVRAAIPADIDFILEQPITPEAAWWNDGAGGSHTCA